MRCLPARSYVDGTGNCNAMLGLDAEGARWHRCNPCRPGARQGAGGGQASDGLPRLAVFALYRASESQAELIRLAGGKIRPTSRSSGCPPPPSTNCSPHIRCSKGTAGSATDRSRASALPIVFSSFRSSRQMTVPSCLRPASVLGI